jgi:predicted HicB family RNase H-like nuclease
MKTIPVSFRIPIETHKAISKKADTANMSLTDFLKKGIIDNQSVIQANEPKKTKNEQHIIRIASQISNNLNQITHRLNADNLAGALNNDKYDRLNSVLMSIRHELKRMNNDS